MAEIKITNKEELEAWLRDKPNDWAVAIAARTALRVVPSWQSALSEKTSKIDKISERNILALFRCVAVSRLSALMDSNVSLKDAAFSAASPDAMQIPRNAYAAQSARSAAMAVYQQRGPSTASAASAASRSARSAAETFIAISADATALQLNDPMAITGQLWRTVTHFEAETTLTDISISDRGYGKWFELRELLMNRGDHWSVWSNWYEPIFIGDSPWGLPATVGHDITFEALNWPESEWEQGPAYINGRIAALVAKAHAAPLEEKSIPIEPVPKQGAGPHVRLGSSDRIERQDPSEMDGDGNDIGRINTLRPLVLECATDLQARLSRNEFPELLSSLENYGRALQPPDGQGIAWGEVWGLGVVLQNAADAARREIASRILPELEDPSKTALDSLLTLHGPMILASREGRELADIAAGYLMTREQLDALWRAAKEVADRLKNHPEVIAPDVAEMVAVAADSIGKGTHPERGAAFGTVSLKNSLIVLVAGAVAASPTAIGFMLGGPAGAVGGAFIGSPLTVVMIETLKKTSAFTSITAALSQRVDHLSDQDFTALLESNARRLAPFRAFVIANAEPLRNIAAATPELKWMLRYIDFITKKPDKP